jgi:hypothetical protein
MIRSWTAVPLIALLSQRETTVPPSNFNSEWGIARSRRHEFVRFAPATPLV